MFTTVPAPCLPVPRYGLGRNGVGVSGSSRSRARIRTQSENPAAFYTALNAAPQAAFLPLPGLRLYVQRCFIAQPSPTTRPREWPFALATGHSPRTGSKGSCGSSTEVRLSTTDRSVRSDLVFPGSAIYSHSTALAGGYSNVGFALVPELPATIMFVAR